MRGVANSGDTGTAKKRTGRPKGRKNTKKYEMTEKALAQRREHTALKYARNDEEREYNSKLIEHIMRIHEIAQNADRTDVMSLKSCFIAYLRLCQEDGFNISNLAAYASMGMDHKAFGYYEKKDDPEMKAFCKFVKETCAMFRENLVADSKLNPVIGIFWQRNFDGLRNDTEQVQAITEQNEEYSGSSGYKDRYRKLIGGEHD